MLEIHLLKNKKPKKYPLLNIIVITFISFIFLFTQITTYDKYKIIAINNNDKNICKLNTTIPYNKINILDNSFIEYKNKRYDIINVEYNQTQVENNLAYENITFSLKTTCKEKVLNLSIYNNKQRIIEKIIRNIKEE